MTDEQVRATQQAFEAITDFICDTWDAITDLLQKVYNWFHDRYTEAGAIYGDTHDGMLRWYGELATIARLRREADPIEQRHQMIADFQQIQR